MATATGVFEAAETPVDKEKINAVYDKTMFADLTREYGENSDFHNLGYWHKGISSQKQASEELMRRLLAFIPQKEGSILDVACGKGATTRALLEYFDPKHVTGINISELQLQRCRVNAPECKFLLMDATRLEFGDATFNNVICVEAAFHFNTREKFLREAFRVLKPGGYLVTSDLFLDRKSESGELTVGFRTPNNFVENPAQYEQLYRRIGFTDVEVVDATAQCAWPYFNHLLRFLVDRFESGKLDRKAFVFSVQRAMWAMKATCYYVLAAARKPVAPAQGVGQTSPAAVEKKGG